MNLLIRLAALVVGAVLPLGLALLAGAPLAVAGLAALLGAAVILVGAHRLLRGPVDRLTAEVAALTARRDTMARQLDEQARQLAASRARLAAFFENSLDWLALHRVKPDGRIFYEDINPACAEAYGLVREQVVGRPLESILGAEQAAGPMEVQRECVRTGRPGRYTAERTMAGRTFTIDVVAVPVPDEVEDGDRFVVTAARDVTARERFNERLRQTQKMESVGQLTGGIAHDFNNLLTAVIPNLEMIVEEVESPRARRLADTALNAARRGAALIQQLLSFARRQALHPTAVELAPLLGEIDALLRRAVGVAIEIRLTIAAGVWPAKVDAAQFEAAIMNLVMNARDAMPDGGTVEIAAENLDEAGARGRGLPAAEFVVVQVRDSGTGIDPQVLPKIFEPFFTTKEVGKGSGLGLSMVQGFVSQSGGVVRVDSALGRGTTVSLYLPRAAEPAQAGETDIGPETRNNVVMPFPSRLGAARPAGGARPVRVLVVEDDAHVRDTVLALLQPRGYSVVLAATGAEALDRLRADPSIDVMFSDLVMPGAVSGLELARQARAARPDLKILLASGYSEEAARLHDLAFEFPFLAKPYQPTQLLSVLRQLLDGARV